MKKILEGYFGLNEQDPYEPTGIIFKNQFNNNDIICLDTILEQDFNIKPNSDNRVSSKRLRITIEELNDDEPITWVR